MENATIASDAALRHPLDPLSAEEIALAVRVLRTQAPVTSNLRFVSVNLHEPAKTELDGSHAGHGMDRRAFIIVIDPGARRVLEAIVSLRDGSLLSCEEHHGRQPGIILE